MNTLSRCILLATLGIGGLQSAHAVTDPFGTAGDFNKFILGNVTHSGGDSEGPVAIAGDANLSNYGIADRTPSASVGLVVGGSLTQNGGQTFAGDVYVGGTVNSISTILNGSLNNPSTPIDFAGEASYLQTLSDYWFSLAATGSVNLQSWGGLELTGTDPDLNVFTLTEAQWQGTKQVNLSVPASASVIINIPSSSDTLPGNRGWFGSMFNNNSTNAVDWQKVVWNFPALTSFSIQNIGWKGTLFAPQASFQYANGNVEGHLIVKEITSSSSAETHWYPFAGDLPAPEVEDVVEEPSEPEVPAEPEEPSTDNSVLIPLEDNKDTAFSVELTSHEENTWSYEVSHENGRDLSHWVLLVPDCAGHYVEYTAGAEIGKDGSIKNREVYGIKWNSTGGTFSFTLDDDYAETLVEVLVKSGTNYATAYITGPSCVVEEEPVDPEAPIDPETPVDPEEPADPETPVTPEEPVAQCDAKVYAVHDGGLNNSQLFTIDPSDGFSITALGEMYPAYDIESLDMQPETNVLYAASGDDTEFAGHLYIVDKDTGALTDLGSTGLREVDALSFSPDGMLWGWAQDAGLFVIEDLENSPVATVVIASGGEVEVEDLSWNQAGTILYGVQDIHDGADPDGADNDSDMTLWKYEVANNMITTLCPEVTDSIEIEALETLPDDSLAFGFHGEIGMVLGVLDTESCQIIGQLEIPTSYNDVEGIAWPDCE